MLSKNEELRLEKILEEITRDINRYFYLTSTESLWLAEKLKEVNEELKDLKEDLERPYPDPEELNYR